MRSILALGSAFHLRVIQIRRHVRRWVDKPNVDVARCYLGVGRCACDYPRDGVVEDGVGHGTETASVVDKETLRIKHAIPIVVWAFNPNYL